jgi:hypothetical protein
MTEVLQRSVLYGGINNATTLCDTLVKDFVYATLSFLGFANTDNLGVTLHTRIMYDGCRLIRGEFVESDCLGCPRIYVVYQAQSDCARDIFQTLAHELSHLKDWQEGRKPQFDLPYDSRPEEIRAQDFADVAWEILVEELSLGIESDMTTAYLNLGCAMRRGKMMEKIKLLTAEDIIPGKTYRGKRPRRGRDYRTFEEVVDDRYVMWVSPDKTKVQYDNCVVTNYKMTTMEAFLKWAKHEVVI